MNRKPCARRELAQVMSTTEWRAKVQSTGDGEFSLHDFYEAEIL